MRHACRRVRSRLAGELDPAWSMVPGDPVVSVEVDGTTALSGGLPAQAAVHGLLASILDLGLPLVSVETSLGAV